MTKKLQEAVPLFLRSLLATLPLLGLAGSSGKGLAYGSVGVAILLVATVIFLEVRPVLPRKVQRLSFFLLLFVGTVFAAAIFSLSLLLGVSILLFALPDLFQKDGNGKQITMETFKVSFFFWAFLTGYGILIDLARLTGSAGFFQLPTGSFFLAALTLSLLARRRVIA